MTIDHRKYSLLMHLCYGISLYSVFFYAGSLPSTACISFPPPSTIPNIRTLMRFSRIASQLVFGGGRLPFCGMYFHFNGKCFQEAEALHCWCLVGSLGRKLKKSSRQNRHLIQRPLLSPFQFAIPLSSHISF